MEKLTSDINSLKLTSNSVEEPAIIKNEQFLRDVLFYCDEFSSWENKTLDKPFHLVLDNFPDVETRFDDTMIVRNFTIGNILRVENPFLLAQYCLKKEQLMRRNHRTIVPICQNNFDWRIVQEGKFGYGISFSPRSDYAKHYCDWFEIRAIPDLTNYLESCINKVDDLRYVMFSVKVLQGIACYGDYKNIIPDDGYDTTTNGKDTVYVKYEDSEFYPEYIILMD